MVGPLASATCQETGAIHSDTVLTPAPEEWTAGHANAWKRIKWSDNTSADFWAFVILALFLLLVVLPWLIRHPPPDHHPGDAGRLGDQPRRVEGLRDVPEPV